MTKKLKALIEKYPYIVAWGRMMGSYGYYIENKLLEAEENHAPPDATYLSSVDNTWVTINDLSDTTKDDLEAYKNGHKGGVVVGWTNLEEGEVDNG